MWPTFLAERINNAVRRSDVLRAEAGCNDSVPAAIRGAESHGVPPEGKFRGGLLIPQRLSEWLCQGRAATDLELDI